VASSPFYQHTLAGPAIFAGVGVHSGQHVRVSIRPAPAGAGITFVRTDVTDRDNRIPARGDLVVQTQLGTVIGNDAGAKVSTVEHLMAAFAALGVDNAVVELDGPEVPIMDGSASPFVDIIDRAGLRRQEAARSYIEILETIEVTDQDKSAKLSPADQFEMSFQVKFDSKAIGHQSVDEVLDEAMFRAEFADCRTFGFVEEVDALRAAGLARGGSLNNVVVIEGDDILNPEGLRRDKEMVRHKAIDALGDLYLLGAPLLGRFEGIYSGHGVNNALVRALLETPKAWRWTTLNETLAQAV